MKSRFLAKNISILATAAVCAALYVTASVKYHDFFSIGVFINFFADNSFLGIIAVGMTFVIISGGIDLSVGALMALCSIVMAVLMSHGISPEVSILFALVVGSMLGCVMGCIIHFTKLAPFIVTLAGMFLARGMAYIVHLEAVPIQNGFYSYVSQMTVGAGPIHVPITAVIYIVCVLAGLFILAYTPFGRTVFAVGGNEDASVMMGLPVGRTRILVYTLSGFCSALAAVVYTFYQSAGNPTAGMGLELDAIAVVVIGGTLLTGGAGGVLGTLLGTLIFGIIQTGIMFQGTLSSWWTKVAIGSLLLIFVAFQKLLSRKDSYRSSS
jgi:galactofuranose transport system permease protein